MPSEAVPEPERANYEIFRECLSEIILQGLALPKEEEKRRKKNLSAKRRERKEKKEKLKRLKEERKKQGDRDGMGDYGRFRREEGSWADGLDGGDEGVSGLDEYGGVEGGNEVDGKDEEGEIGEDAEELGEFIDYLTTLLFPSLPPDLRTLSHSTFKASASLQEKYTPPLTLSTTTPLLSLIPPSAIDTLISASLIPSSTTPPPDLPTLSALLTPVYNTYLQQTTSPPPKWSSTRTSSCELCHRSWIPLTYHHLIPKSVHEKAVKRKWHKEEDLNRVAWLCRACHSFVHRLESNEELARRWHSVELLEEREDVRSWVGWVGRVRWKKQ